MKWLLALALVAVVATSYNFWRMQEEIDDLKAAIRVRPEPTFDVTPLRVTFIEERVGENEAALIQLRKDLQEWANAVTSALNGRSPTSSGDPLRVERLQECVRYLSGGIGSSLSCN